MMSIPFIFLSLILKQVRFTELNSIEQKNIQYFIPGYPSEEFSKNKPARAATKSIVKYIGENGRRMFSPVTLPRRYANALIFPSARCNVFTEFHKGQRLNWGGWTLVDCQNAPIPFFTHALDDSATWDIFPTLTKMGLLTKPPLIFCIKTLKSIKAKRGRMSGP